VRFEYILMWRQKSPEVTGKIKPVLARLDRLRLATEGAGDDAELKRRAILFE